MADWQPPMEEKKATRREHVPHVQLMEVMESHGRNRNATNALQRPQALACSGPPYLKEEIKATHAHLFPRIPTLVGTASLKCARGVATAMTRLHAATIYVNIGHTV